VLAWPAGRAWTGDMAALVNLLDSLVAELIAADPTKGLLPASAA